MDTPRSPSPLPSPIPTTNTLPYEINSATRQLHTHLNRLITSRLPLALPPYASTPDLYARGLRHFAQLYFTFEALWSDLTRRVHSDELNKTTNGPPSSTLQSSYRTWLADLPPTSLPRTTRLRADLAHLFRNDDEQHDPRREPPQTPSTPAVRAAIAHVQRAVEQRPHVLLAYAWVLYMAIFSGGRWIRSALFAAGAEFWTADDDCGGDGGGDAVSAATENDDAVRPSAGFPGFTFLSFDGDEDGEDVKSAFKAGLAGAEELLDEGQRRDVVLEAQEIFRLCISLVEELDGPVSAAVPSARTGQSFPPATTTPKQSAIALPRWRIATPSAGVVVALCASAVAFTAYFF
ncbi:hypothetical protein LTR50_003435 [Elasticomyces elasticus]|nr:hypothetical protein LTR50_003435 [Elasticomyces elasticus]